MKLIGWTKELPSWIEEAILNKILKTEIIKEHEYLVGKVKSPYGYIIEFQGEKNDVRYI